MDAACFAHREPAQQPDEVEDPGACAGAKGTRRQRLLDLVEITEIARLGRNSERANSNPEVTHV